MLNGCTTGSSLPVSPGAARRKLRNRNFNAGFPEWKRQWLWHMAERFLLALGLMLLTGYASAMLLRVVGSGAAINGIEIPKPEPEGANAAGVDFGLWSGRRAKAFQRSLALLTDEPMAVLSIPRLKIKAPVFSGTGDFDLNRGVGWIRGTAKPGESGNSGIAGHRDGFFRALKDAQVGDTVDLKTPKAQFTFRVDEIEVVTPADIRVLNPRGNSSITLVTCFPFYFVGAAPHRFIVHASLETQETTDSVRDGGAARGEAASKTHQGEDK